MRDSDAGREAPDSQAASRPRPARHRASAADGQSTPNPQTQAESTQEAQERQEKATNDRKLVEFTKWLVVATAVLAAIAFLQAGVFGLQARRLRQSVEEMRATTATIRDNAVSELRPYLTVGPPRFPPPALWTKSIVCPHIEIHNAGPTPAYEVAAAFKADLFADDHNFDPRTVLPLNPDEVLGTKSRGMIGPRSWVCSGLPAGYQMKDWELEVVRRGERKLYIYGTVKYRTFKIERHTNYCCYLVLDGENVRARTTQYGNDAT